MKENETKKLDKLISEQKKLIQKQNEMVTRNTKEKTLSYKDYVRLNSLLLATNRSRMLNKIKWSKIILRRKTDTIIYHWLRIFQEAYAPNFQSVMTAIIRYLDWGSVKNEGRLYLIMVLDIKKYVLTYDNGEESLSDEGEVFLQQKYDEEKKNEKDYQKAMKKETKKYNLKRKKDKIEKSLKVKVEVLADELEAEIIEKDMEMTPKKMIDGALKELKEQNE